jgi:hypothetical protein
MTVMNENLTAKPWLAVPWLLMAGPLAVIAAGMVTFWLSVSSDDGMVAADYYKRGLAINQTLLRAQTAERLKLGARVTMDLAARRAHADLTGLALPAELRLRLVHPTRAVADQVIPLSVVSPGIYAGDILTPYGGRRVLLLEDAERTWRLAGEATSETQTVVDLTP